MLSFIKHLFWLDLRVVLTVFVTILFLVYLIRRPRNLPPGPRGLPVIGYALQFIWARYQGEPLHRILNRLRKEYGNIFSFYIFGIPFVILNDYGMIREGFNNPVFSDKGVSNTMLVKMAGRMFGPYKKYLPFRRFTLATFRSLGVGKRSFEENIAIEAKALCDVLSSKSGTACDPKPFFHNAAGNVICSIVFADRYEYGDHRFLHLMDLNNALFELMGAGGLNAYFPVDIPNKASRDILPILDDYRRFITEKIEEHHQKFDPDHLNDFIDVYLNELNKTSPSTDPYSYLQHDNVVTGILGLFLAGTDTTGLTLTWALIYLMAYPDVLEQIHQELDSVVGRNRLPQLSDKSSLPYTMAAIFELQRVIALLPTMGHTSSIDTVFRGYYIPKNSSVIANLHAVMLDPILWPEPDQFKPERFLDDNGKFVEREEVIPFLVGRRVCLGERLAEMELFIFFTHLLHRFSFKRPHGSPPLSFTATEGLFQVPSPYEVQFVERG